jgi:tetratricopeptide (TPR) repeat protein
VKGHVGWQILIFVLALGLAGTLVWWQWDASRHQYTEQPEPPKLREVPSLEVPTTAPAFSNEYILVHASQFDPATVAKAIPHVDPRLVQWMEAYVQHRAVQTSPDLEDILSGANLNFAHLIALSDSMHWVPEAAPIHAAAVAQAEKDLKGANPEEENTKELLAALWRLGDGLKTLKEWSVAERMYGSMMQLEPQKLDHSRSAAALHAEQLYNLGRYSDASEAYSSVLSRVSEQMPEPEKADLKWEKGLMLFCLEQHDQAIGFLREASDVPGPAQKNSTMFLYECLVRSGRTDDAKAVCDRYIAMYSPPKPLARYMRSRISQHP